MFRLSRGHHQAFNVGVLYGRAVKWASEQLTFNPHVTDPMSWVTYNAYRMFWV
jgi:hypothetical protein